MHDFYDDGTMRRFSAEAEERKAEITGAATALSRRGVFVPSRFDYDLSKASFIGIGGIVSAAFYPDTLASATQLFGILKERKIPFLLLGKASNVLFPDGLRSEKKGDERERVVDDSFFENERGVLKGAAVFTENLKSIATDGEHIFAFCGATGAQLLRAAAEAGLTGAEFLAGIPCSVGGATYMNAGAGGRQIAEIVESVLAYRKGEMRVYSQKECRFAYKESAFMQSGEAVLGVTFRLKRSTRTQAEALIRLAKEKRAHLPKGKSLGCVFKNPQSPFGRSVISAGALIDRVGMKGVRVGGAEISKEHANFIVNGGGATYRDVRRLIVRMQDAVRQAYGVHLAEEIRYAEDLWQ